MACLNTCEKTYSIWFKWSSSSIFENRVPNWRHGSLSVFRIFFDFEKLTLSCRGSFEETKVSQKCSEICIYRQTANSSVKHIGTIMIFGWILEGVRPINNQKKFLLCDFRCQSKSGITGFFTHLHYSTYKPSQVEDVVLWVTHHCIIIYSGV